MSDHINLKDVRKNAQRLMDEEDYDQALKNWIYIKKNVDNIEPNIQYNIGK
jgi:hypothetical protein